MPGKFDAAEIRRLDASNEELGQDPVARTGARFWTAFSVALGVAVIGVLAFAWSAADGRLRLELKSAIVAPVSVRTHEIDRLRRQVGALKNEIAKLKDAREQTAQMPATYWYSDPTALGFGIESPPKREGPLPRRSPAGPPSPQ